MLLKSLIMLEVVKELSTLVDVAIVKIVSESVNCCEYLRAY
jgi:hypothetical protein